MRERGISGAVIFVIAAVVVLLNLPDAATRHVKSSLREVLLPLQQVVAAVSIRAREISSTIRGLGGMIQRNRELETEVARLRQRLLRCESVERQNLALRELLGFMRQDQRELLPCEVIGRDISGWWETIRLSKGRAHGVHKNMAVVSSSGLIGKTIDSSEGGSDVLLLTDPSCKISVGIVRTGAFGVMRGLGGSWSDRAVCRMDYIDLHASIRPGDEVVTSGLGGVYPKGIMVGTVERMGEDPSGLYQYAEVLPAADMSWLEYAFVIVQTNRPADEKGDG